MMISAMMLIAISSGVSAFNSSPVGARTSSSGSSLTPISRNALAAVSYRRWLPIAPT